ncbi:Aprataxin-like protein [Golovinomyces cichoracearum]|uniref:Aprataxin-like protein n=1 Tax=Golovinomyces cichoracearum TaxID=62708 RepID=A0A420HBK0_9PEZI|nr:Aprataxin-like protein [Golovinomyces cichoracearum]
MANKQKICIATLSPKGEMASVRKPRSKNPNLGRDALGLYIKSPEKYDTSMVVSYNNEFVVIKDKFPKSSVHMLILPRDTKFSRLHPFEAFEHAEFLASVQLQLKKVKEMVVNEIRNRYGIFSLKDAQRQNLLREGRAVESEIEEDDRRQPLTGRNWDAEVISGIHARPSMNHLHIHVLSVDRLSDSLKHRKHYNSFTTNFFIPLEDFPLPSDDVRRFPEREGYLNSELKCWRCGKNFGNKFSNLKKHLSDEFEEWKRV